jgi:hypothetical protein
VVAREQGALELLRGDATKVPGPRDADKGNVYFHADGGVGVESTPWTSAAVDSDISSGAGFYANAVVDRLRWQVEMDAGKRTVAFRQEP